MNKETKELLESIDLLLERSLGVSDMWTGTQYESRIEHYRSSIIDLVKLERYTEAKEAVSGLIELLDTADQEYDR